MSTSLLLEDLSRTTDLATATLPNAAWSIDRAACGQAALLPLAPLFTVFVLLGVLSFAAIATSFNRRRTGPGGDGGGDAMPPHAAARH